MSVILGVAGGFGHDAAAALVVDGLLVALVEEERLIRKKRASGEVPHHAMIACIKMAGLELADVDTLSVAWDSSLAPELQALREIENRLSLDGLAPKTTQRYSHHLCHAASAAWFHPCDKPAVVVVADGRGETSSTSVFRQGEDGHLSLLDHSPVQSSLGSFYAAVTHFTGCGIGGQGKSMALAAYGTARHLFDELDVDGMRIEFQPKGVKLESVGSPRLYWYDRFCQVFGQPRPSSVTSPHLTGAEHQDYSANHADAAASAQFTLETVLGNLVGNISNSYPELPVLMSGGVALNCSANKTLRQRCGKLLLNPIPHDGGSALGAALLALREEGHALSTSTPTPYLGQEWDVFEIRRILDAFGISSARTDTPLNMVVDGLSSGAVVGWFDGRAEAGPRALGHRSILASAATPGVAARVNALKGREPWRPFGPSVLDEDASGLFDTRDTPYMIEAVDVPDMTASSYLNITHKDQTTLPQTVGASQELATYRLLLEAIRAETGTGIVLNTSFNVGSEPIVNSPTDAIRTFYSSALDMLYLGGQLLVKDTWNSKRW